MKRRNARTLTMYACLGFLAIAFLKGACGGAGAITETLTAPTLDAVRTAMSVNNAFGIVPGLSLGEIILPECTGATNTDDVTYELVGIPDWLAFDAATRALTLAEGTIVVPAEAYTLGEVTYTCTEETPPAPVPTPTSLAKAVGVPETASVTFPVNDLDGGGVVDGREYEFGKVPLLNNTNGWAWLTPGNVEIYRAATTSPHKISTGIVITDVGMDPTDATDDTGDFDGDGSANNDEITNGTNMFVATSDGTLVQDNAYATGITPSGIAAADFDNDGDLDLIATNREGVGSIRPLINDGSGTFTPGADYSNGSHALAVVAADFNGDGNMDAATSDATVGSNSVSVLLGNGDGTFGTKTSYAVGTTPQDIVAADFNGDGIVDLASVNPGDSNVSILLGAGNGTFGTATNVGAGLVAWELVFADFDADNDLDLAVANAGAKSVSILTNNGSGTFTETSVLGCEDDPRSLTTGDFNGDGAVDIAAMVWVGSEDINIFLNNGDGTFGTYTAVPFSDKPYGIVAADLDGDSNVDLALTQFGAGNVGVLISNGDGTFGTATLIAVGTAPWGIVAADFNDDGKVDLANVNSAAFNDSASILLNQ